MRFLPTLKFSIQFYPVEYAYRIMLSKFKHAGNGINQRLAMAQNIERTSKFQVFSLQNIRKLKGDLFEALKSFRKTIKNDNYQQSDGAEKCERGLCCKTDQFCCKISKQVKRRHFGDIIKIRKTFHCAEKHRRGSFSFVRFCMVR